MSGLYSNLSDFSLKLKIKHLETIESLKLKQKVKLKLLYKEKSKRLSKATMTIKNLLN